MKKIFYLFILIVCAFQSYVHAETKEKSEAIKNHSVAVHITDGWIRDPYIVLGPDNYYYLTGTTPLENDDREQSDYHNTGLGKTSVVGYKLRVWKSTDLVNWEYLGAPYSVKDTPHFTDKQDEVDWSQQRLWAPELHWTGDKWVLVHCPSAVSSLALTEGLEIKGPWEHPNPEVFIKKHDPSIFIDDDGQPYLLWGYHGFFIRALKKDFSDFAGPRIEVGPSDRIIGHEGTTMKKIGNKYVYIGTAWSTDTGRKGSYNLYYCTGDNPTGPFSERRFLGRFLGHGTPFQDKEGKWWCTAFYNANVPTLESEGIQTRDLSETAQTINKQGTTIVPLEVKIMNDGDVFINAKDPRYAVPGPDETQKFDLNPI